MSMAKLRYQLSDIPNTEMPCPMDYCVYNKHGKCDEPRTNKGNSDAACHLFSNRALLRFLKVIPNET